MTPDELIAQAKTAGAVFTPDGKLQGASKLPPALRQQIIANKAAIFQRVSAPNVSRPEALYEKYLARPATGGLESMLSRVTPKGWGRTIAENVVPQNLTEAGTDIGYGVANYLTGGAPAELGIMAKLLRGGARIGTAALGGAGGATAEGKGAKTGALQGGLQGALGEAGTGLLNLTGRLGKKALNKGDVGRVGKWLKGVIPSAGNLGTIEDFDTAFRGGQAVEAAGAKLGQMEGEISQWAGKRLLVTMEKPAGVKGGQMGTAKVYGTFDDAIQHIRELNKQGYVYAGDPVQKAAAAEARQAAHEATNELGIALNKMQPGIGDRFLKERRTFAATNLMTRIFSDPEVWPAGGAVDMAELQNLVSQRGAAGFREDLTRILGREKTNQFLKSVGRGKIPIARDVNPGLGTRVGLGTHLPRIYIHPSMGQRVGNVPRRFPKVPALPAVVGSQGLAEYLTQLANPQE